MTLCAYPADTPCPRRARHGSSYCPLHHALCHLPRGGRAERHRLREIRRLAAFVGGRVGCPESAPPERFLARLESVIARSP